MLSFKEMETRIDSNAECRKKKPKNSKPVSCTHTQRKGPVSSWKNDWTFIYVSEVKLFKVCVLKKWFSTFSLPSN